jgi:hypothetical protein
MGGGFSRGGAVETGFPLLGVLALICAVAAGISFAMATSGRPINRDLIAAGLLGGGVAAAVLGCVSLLKELGWGRWLGGISAVAGVVIAFLGYSKLPAAGAPAAAPQQQSKEEAEPAAEPAAESEAALPVHFELKDVYA